MLVDKNLAEAFDRFCFGVGQSDLADGMAYGLDIKLRHGLGVRGECKEIWGDFIDLFVGALRRQKDSHQKSEGIFMVERNTRIRIKFRQRTEDYSCFFAAFHGYLFPCRANHLLKRRAIASPDLGEL